MEPPRHFFTLSAAVGLALLLGACTGESPETGQVSPTATVTVTATAFPDIDGLPSPGATGTASPGATGMASPGATGAATRPTDGRSAVEAAEAAITDGRAVGIDFSNRRQAWKVSVVGGDTEYEVLVSADGREVLDRKNDGSAEPDDRSGLEAASTGLADALRTALDEVPGTLDEASLDEEDGKPVWEIEIDGANGSSTRVKIDAATGDRIR
ncbi:PepSY domain-containing protein [Arthrobacter sp. GCM10027362]|uniref:PepSY domain-containing protein n=1 Tax=Arthrobacter sp. GCM10027362 TaxID=3273379 RepID=UPI0036271C73